MAKEKGSRRSEDLLEAIFEISEGKGYAKPRDIEKTLQITPATVTDGFKRLAEAGLVNYEPYGGVTLTEAGAVIARRTRDSHLIIRRLLELAGVDTQAADRDACVMEHGLSPDSCERMTRIVTFLEACREDERWHDEFVRIVHQGGDPQQEIR